MRRKPNLALRMERCAHLLIKEPENYKGRWRDIMPECDKLYVELGCGKGRFTAETAATMPKTLFVAIEKVNDALVMAMERVERMGLKNVRFISGDVSKIINMFDNGEVERIYINFCDPWPSKRHEKRRLTAPQFLSFYRTVLTDGGQIHFKTDNDALFSYSIEQFTYCGYHLTELTRDLHKNKIEGIMTDYEEKFYNQGTPIKRCVANR